MYQNSRAGWGYLGGGGGKGAGWFIAIVYKGTDNKPVSLSKVYVCT